MHRPGRSRSAGPTTRLFWVTQLQSSVSASNAIRDPEQIRKLTAFFSWTAWAASTARPGHSYSYTNNWPPEPLVDNHATADAIVWSVLSLAALLGGTGLLLASFGRWNLLGWQKS